MSAETIAPSPALNILANTAVVEAGQQEKPTLSQTYATLRVCLRYGDSSANIFKRLIKVLESTDFICMLKMMPDEELERLMPMLAERLTGLRLEITEIPLLYSICRKMGAPALLQVRSCEVIQDNMNPNCFNSSCHLQLLGQLLPRLEVLSIHTVVVAPFPSNFRSLQTLLLRQGTSQLLMDQICAHCPQLQRLFLRNESSGVLDAKNILKCSKLKELQLPLMLRTPKAVCQLTHLERLSLQRLQLWPGMDWLPIVQEILMAKRYELRALSFDGSWLVTPLDLSVLKLKYCWALQEVLLSNCKLADISPHPELPLSCQRLGLRGCKLSRLLRFLNNAQLQMLDFFDCQIVSGGRQLLQHMLKQRQRLPVLTPLQLRFSHSTPLRMELASWTAKRRKQNEEWLKVLDLEQDAPTWKQSIGTITMTFGKPIIYTPDLDLGSSAQTKVKSSR